MVFNEEEEATGLFYRVKRSGLCCLMPLCDLFTGELFTGVFSIKKYSFLIKYRFYL
jgi:hypothetical protein